MNHPTTAAHRRSLTSSPCFFSSGPSNFHNSSHFSTLTFVSADRPIDLRKSAVEQMAPGWFRQRTCFGENETKCVDGGAPRGAGIGRAAVAVCRHLVRKGVRFGNLVTDESSISGEKSAVKSGRLSRSTWIKAAAQSWPPSVHYPWRPLVLRSIVGDSSLPDDCRNFACHSRIVSIAMRWHRGNSSPITDPGRCTITRPYLPAGLHSLLNPSFSPNEARTFSPAIVLRALRKSPCRPSSRLAFSNPTCVVHPQFHPPRDDPRQPSTQLSLVLKRCINLILLHPFHGVVTDPITPRVNDGMQTCRPAASR